MAKKTVHDGFISICSNSYQTALHAEKVALSSSTYRYPVNFMDQYRLNAKVIEISRKCRLEDRLKPQEEGLGDKLRPPVFQEISSNRAINCFHLKKPVHREDQSAAGHEHHLPERFTNHAPLTLSKASTTSNLLNNKAY
jgi:hypothetical protein